MLTILSVSTVRMARKPMKNIRLPSRPKMCIGFLAILTVLTLKIVSMCSPTYHFYVTNSVYFYLSLAAMVMGLQFFLTGFIGELIARNSPERNKYIKNLEL